MCDLMLTRQNICIQLSMTFKILLRGFIEIACFPYGQLPRVDVGAPATCSPAYFQRRYGNKILLKYSYFQGGGGGKCLCRIHSLFLIFVNFFFFLK